MEANLEAVEQEIFQGMVERELNANYSMITEFTTEHKVDGKEIGDTIFKLNDRIDYL